ncbi:hypothetical protein SAMN04488564_10572 [Lentzea waywayandensis]|uniref:Uncharacterized protein n=1 Tax=Lentzea waywayandensis TaxID=84724 RepID=A0A1I6EQC1_9PSEU|nr:hypothetical protein [Lentzea waywayandensis]SFR19964.1 hypothetical protein SAMN04488564_10572 [Lentzea waywayandensis]
MATTLARVIPLVRKAVAPLRPLPEPADLYCRVVIALFLHTPQKASGLCEACGEGWPCAQLKRACFLIEAF